MATTLTQTELVTLAALSQLGDEAYGVTIRRHIRERTRREISLASVYAALDRLHRLGFAKTWLSEPRAERGGRARRHYALTVHGAARVREERALAHRVWRGVTVK